VLTPCIQGRRRSILGSTRAAGATSCKSDDSSAGGDACVCLYNCCFVLETHSCLFHDGLPGVTGDEQVVDCGLLGWRHLLVL
jgi:hypothetical protein